MPPQTFSLEWTIASAIIDISVIHASQIRAKSAGDPQAFAGDGETGQIC
jgi:hypothetical protein